MVSRAKQGASIIKREPLGQDALLTSSEPVSISVLSALTADSFSHLLASALLSSVASLALHNVIKYNQMLNHMICVPKRLFNNRFGSNSPGEQPRRIPTYVVGPAKNNTVDGCMQIKVYKLMY